MNKKVYIATGILLALTACSSNDLENTTNTKDEHVEITAKVNSAIVKSRFINAGALAGQAFSANDKFIIGIKNNEQGSANYSGDCIRTITVADGPTYTPDTPLYWNNIGGVDTDVFIWGVYTHGDTSTDIDKTGKFNWTVTTDQTKVTDFQKLDLLYSNNKTHLVFTPDKSNPMKRDVADLTFNHAMSRILINIKAGDGFSASEFSNATSTLKEQFNSLDVDMISADTFRTVTTSRADVKMCKKTAATGCAASFDAIVAPGKTFEKDTEIATLTVSGNTYILKANEEFVNALGDSKALVKGKYYTFNITLSKKSISFNTVITDWKDGYETETDSFEEAQIIIDSDDKGADQSGTTMPNDFWLYQSQDGTNYDADSTTDGVQGATKCEYDPETGKMSYDPAIYWQGEGDKEYFRGFYADNDENSTFTQNGNSNSAPIAAGGYDYQWGTSGTDKVSPTSGNVKMLFTHKMSQINVNLVTVSGDEAVNLDRAQVRFTSTYINGSIDLHSGAISLTSKGECLLTEPTVEGNHTYTKYVIPQLLSDDIFVEITTNPGDVNAKNTYKLQLNKAYTIVNGVATSIKEWKENTNYIYNIKITKTGINLSSQIVDWKVGYNNDFNIEL